MRIRTFSVHLPQHPVLRALVTVAAIAALATLAAFGLILGVAAIAVLAAIAGWRRWRRRRTDDAAIIEGEFTVLPRRHDALPRPE